jgi:hypothetical protein
MPVPESRFVGRRGQVRRVEPVPGRLRLVGEHLESRHGADLWLARRGPAEPLDEDRPEHP